MKNLEEHLQSVRTVYVNLPKQYDLAKSSLQTLNNEIQDLLHVIELGKLDAVAASRINKDLKKAQVERRKVKNELEVLEEVMRFVSIKNPKKHEYDKIIGRVRSVIEKQGRRTYTMRVRPDLQNLIK